jgi:peroxiredoxin
MRSFTLLVSFLSVVLLAPWQPALSAGPRDAQIGRAIDNFSLRGPGGKPFHLHDLKDKKAIVIVFLSFDCPISNSYTTLLSDLARSSEAIALVGVCPTGESSAEVERQARERRLGFPVFHDGDKSAVNALHAETTPEALVLDGRFVLRYRGRIDDAYRERGKPNARVSCHDLRTALDEVLAGKPVSQPVTTPIGCPIPRDVSVAATGKVTFCRDVLPILQQRCQSCHRPGEIGPFALLTYEHAVRWASDIKEQTRSRRMPPWRPVEGLAFRDERKLTAEEINTLSAWVNGGTPRGEAKDAPPPVTFPEGWQLGKPDLVLAPDREFTLGATGPDVYRCFVIPTNLTEDQYVIGFEVHPGNARVVHHTIHFIDTRGIGRKFAAEEEKRTKRPDEIDSGPGYTSWMLPGFLPDGEAGGWAPGVRPLRLPDGVGYYLPKGSDIVLQVHYHRDGKVEKDRTRVGLYFAKRPGTRPIQPMAVAALFARAPAGAENYNVRGSLWVAQDCTLQAVIPHMHLIGKKIKITMTPPGGPTTTLVAIDDWDFDWQEIYFLKRPIRVKANTRFTVEGTYDNSANNPRNPNHPPKGVWLGEMTTNEMCLGLLGVTLDEPGWIGVKLGPDSFVVRRPGHGPGPAHPRPSEPGRP